MKEDVVVVKPFSRNEIVYHSDRSPNMCARLAMEYVKEWGMIMAATDGEDSAGRAKLRIATPDEVTERACEVASLLLEKLERRGWLLKAPSIEEYLSKDR